MREEPHWQEPQEEVREQSTLGPSQQTPKEGASRRLFSVASPEDMPSAAAKGSVMAKSHQRHSEGHPEG